MVDDDTPCYDGEVGDAGAYGMNCVNSSTSKEVKAMVGIIFAV